MLTYEILINEFIVCKITCTKELFSVILNSVIENNKIEGAVIQARRVD